jgi:hypothetical protein
MFSLRMGSSGGILQPAHLACAAGRATSAAAAAGFSVWDLGLFLSPSSTSSFVDETSSFLDELIRDLGER